VAVLSFTAVGDDHKKCSGGGKHKEIFHTWFFDLKMNMQLSERVESHRTETKKEKNNQYNNQMGN